MAVSPVMDFLLAFRNKQRETYLIGLRYDKGRIWT